MFVASLRGVRSGTYGGRMEEEMFEDVEEKAGKERYEECPDADA